MEKGLLKEYPEKTEVVVGSPHGVEEVGEVECKKERYQECEEVKKNEELEPFDDFDDEEDDSQQDQLIIPKPQPQDTKVIPLDDLPQQSQQEEVE